MRIEEIVAIYTALMAENKSILVVCDYLEDLIPIVSSLLELMHPFEWSLQKIPFLMVDDPKDIKDPRVGLLWNEQPIILGIKRDCFNSVCDVMAMQPETLESIIVLELVDLLSENQVED